MMLHFCPFCGGEIGSPRSLAGHQTICPHCEKKSRVPDVRGDLERRREKLRRRRGARPRLIAPREVSPFCIQFFYNLRFTGGPLDGKECHACQDPGGEIAYVWLDLQTRRRIIDRYVIETSFNFERYYQHVPKPAFEPPREWTPASDLEDDSD